MGDPYRDEAQDPLWREYHDQCALRLSIIARKQDLLAEVEELDAELGRTEKVSTELWEKMIQGRRHRR